MRTENNKCQTTLVTISMPNFDTSMKIVHSSLVRHEEDKMKQGMPILAFHYSVNSLFTMEEQI